MSCSHCKAAKARKKLREREKAKGDGMTFYDLLFNAIVEAKVTCAGWGYKRAEKFAEKRLAETLNLRASAGKAHIRQQDFRPPS